MKKIISIIFILCCVNLSANLRKLDSSHPKFTQIFNESKLLHPSTLNLPNLDHHKIEIIKSNETRLLIAALKLKKRKKYYLFSSQKDIEALIEKLKNNKVEGLGITWHYLDNSKGYATFRKENDNKAILFKLPDLEYEALIKKHVDEAIRSKY